MKQSFKVTRSCPLNLLPVEEDSAAFSPDGLASIRPVSTATFTPDLFDTELLVS